MALYMDCALVNTIVEIAKTVPIAGVTTNPTILLQAREKGQTMSDMEILSTLLRQQDGLVFMQPGMTDEEAMFDLAVEYIKLSPDRVIPKIPITPKGVRVARRLQRVHFRFAFTAVTTVAQVYTAAMMQADFVIPYYGRLERSGIDANKRIASMFELIRKHNLPTRILASSLKTPEDVIRALNSGAQDITATPEVLMNMLSDPLSEDAVQKFEQDWLKMKNL